MNHKSTVQIRMMMAVFILRNKKKVKDEEYNNGVLWALNWVLNNKRNKNGNDRKRKNT